MNYVSSAIRMIKRAARNTDYRADTLTPYVLPGALGNGAAVGTALYITNAIGNPIIAALAGVIVVGTILFGSYLGGRVVTAPDNES